MPYLECNTIAKVSGTDRERVLCTTFFAGENYMADTNWLIDTAKRVICGGYFASTSVQDVEEKIRRWWEFFQFAEYREKDTGRAKVGNANGK